MALEQQAICDSYTFFVIYFPQKKINCACIKHGWCRIYMI